LFLRAALDVIHVRKDKVSDPASADGYIINYQNLLGLSLMGLGRTDEARDMFERSVAMGNDAAVGYINMLDNNN
jgi:Flp pilus assembly protein TadD